MNQTHEHYLNHVHHNLKALEEHNQNVVSPRSSAATVAPTQHQDQANICYRVMVSLGHCHAAAEEVVANLEANHDASL